MTTIQIDTSRGPVEIELNPLGRPAAGRTVARPTAAERRRGAGGWIPEKIGPRKVGGVYWDGYWGLLFEVIAIETGRTGWPAWEITERELTGDRPGHVRKHCTGWDYRRDLVVQEPPDPS